MSKILGAHIPLEPKNLAINGALDFWQRVEGTTTTVNTATTAVNRTADMTVVESAGATVKNYSVARSADVPTLAQSGFNSTYSYLFTMITGIASPAAGDYVIPFEYRMEGFDYERIHTKSVTFGFWVKASVAGTYSFALTNNAANRTYVTTFTINAGSTWEFKSITVTLDNTGTWLFDTNSSLSIYIGAISGSTFQTSSLGSWQAAALISSSTSTNWQATNGATFQIAQFSIVEGTLGLGATGFLRNGKAIQQELDLCKRYYEKSYIVGSDAPGAVTANGQAQTGQPNNAVWQWTHFWTVAKATRGYSTLIWDPVAGTSSHVHNTTGGSLTAASNGGEQTHITITCSQAPGIANTIIQYHVTGDAGL